MISTSELPMPAAALIIEIPPYSCARDAKDALSYPECRIFKS